MHSRWSLILLATVVAAPLSMLCAQDAPAPAPNERERVVRISRALESDPLGKDAAELRKWALTWLIDHPELDFNVCTSLLAPLLKSERKYSSEINMQMVISGG